MDAQSILESVGYFGVFLSVFIECGVPLGLILPLPGWSMLFAAGVFASGGHMDIALVLGIGLAAAILGYLVGYFTGYKYGRQLFYEKKTKKYFTKEQGQKTEKLMKRFGSITLVFGRFLPIVHNLAPILGGFSRVPMYKFMILNVVGAVMWVASAVYLGFYAGKTIPNSELYIIPFVLLVLIIMNLAPVRNYAKNILEKIEKT